MSIFDNLKQITEKVISDNTKSSDKQTEPFKKTEAASSDKDSDKDSVFSKISSLVPSLKTNKTEEEASNVSQGEEGNSEKVVALVPEKSSDDSSKNWASLLDEGMQKVKDAMPSKKDMIKIVAGINYAKIQPVLGLVAEKYPLASDLDEPFRILGEAAAIYQASDSENKDDEFLDYLKENMDVRMLIMQLEPVVSFLPYGNLIMTVLKLVIL